MRRLILIGMMFFSTQSMADALGDFFTGMGNAVTTSPQSFQGQTMNTFVGGSVAYRVPQRTYQLASFSPPSVTAGCGGIDAYAGAFSFINSDQLVQMLQNIGNNATGAIFKLAIDSVSPQLGGVMDYMNKLAQDVNSLNINSCQAAEGVVTAVTGTANEKATKNYLTNFGSQVSNVYSDVFNARSEISANIQKRKDALEQAKASADGVADKLKDVNITWDALRNFKYSDGSGLDDTQIKFLMTTFGATICTSKGDDPNNPPTRVCNFYAPDPTINQKLILGGNYNGQVYLLGNTCSSVSGNYNEKNCLYDNYMTMGSDPFKFTVNGKDYTSFADYIKAQMNVLRTAISGRSVLDKNSSVVKEAYGIVSMSSVPAYILIKLAAMDPSSNAFYDRAVDTVATDAAYNYLASAAQAIIVGLNHEKADSKYFATDSDIKAVDKQITYISWMLDDLRKGRRDNEQKLAQLGTISSSIKLLSSSLEDRMANIRNRSGS